MNDTWEGRAIVLATGIAEDISASLETLRLSDRLLEFRFSPKNAEAASMSMIVTPTETIFSAGRGARCELPPLPAAEAVILSLVMAVAGGRLTERTSGGRVDFELSLEDGTTCRGHTRSKLLKWRGGTESRNYAPYSTK